MARTLSAFLVGLIFGFGLILSQMVSPAKVLGFLDLVGNWDPSLAFVMGGALLVTAIGYRIVFTRTRPVFDTQFHLPTKTDLDNRLLGGAALFGIGWGLGGFCPGPALSATGTGAWQALLFVVCMLVGMGLQRTFFSETATVPAKS